MKDLISDIAEQFYSQIMQSEYFSSFFLGKDYKFIKSHMKEYMYDQLTCTADDFNFNKSYELGMMHSKAGVPLNNVLSFINYFQTNIYEYCEKEVNKCSELKLGNIRHIKNWFAKGYLHESVNKTDMMSVPLFSVLSTTKIATSVISWINDITRNVQDETLNHQEYLRNDTCDLVGYLEKPFFNMIFATEDNFLEFNKRHLELHNTANSLLYFIEKEDYIQSYVVYNEFVEQCKSFLNFYFERLVLFEQNNENYFYSFAEEKISSGTEISIFTFNIRNMQMINRVWGLDNGDFIVNEVERLIDKKHGMNSEDSVFIKTKNAEFIVMLLNNSKEDTVRRFKNLSEELKNDIPVKGEFSADIKISCSCIPLGSYSKCVADYLKVFTQQAINHSKTDDNLPIMCSKETIEMLNQKVYEEEKIRYFIKQSFDKKNFKPYYQTIHDTVTGQVAHAEVLARVCDDKTCVSAGYFIDYLVSSERIVELDKIMLEKILNEREEIKKFINKIFINVSPKSLRSAEFIALFKEFIVKSKVLGLEPVFEITEQSLLDNVNLLREIHEEYGTTFAIDDFGSGYSNFSMVSELATEGMIKYLKIDGSLIKDIHNNIYKENIVSGVISIATSLNMKIVAEFVSDKEIADKLRELKSNYLQGFYCSVPKPIEEFDK